ncbi:hypothetical protein SGPA1_10174 [Streptomyces misionensis JCM 4497]
MDGPAAGPAAVHAPHRPGRGPQPGGRRQPGAERRPRPQCAGPLRPRCAGAERGPVAGPLRGRQRHRHRRAHRGRTAADHRGSARGLRPDRGPGARAGHPRVRRHADAVRGEHGLRRPGRLPRGGPAGGQPLDPHQRPLRRRPRLRPGGPRPRRAPPAAAVAGRRRPSAPEPRRVPGAGRRGAHPAVRTGPARPGLRPSLTRPAQESALFPVVTTSPCPGRAARAA